jgi:signal transduction histidine kinase
MRNQGGHYHDQPNIDLTPLMAGYSQQPYSGYIAMHASTNAFRFWPLSTRNALWLNAVLCVGSTIGNVALYLTSSEFPAALLLINLVTFASVWQAQLRYGRSIRFQPQELADHMLQVQETERHRLSRELHDDIGQMLTAAKLQSEWLRRRLPSELLEHSAQLNDTLDETLAKVRDVSAILHPRQLTSLGLEASLRGHLLRTLADTQVRWSLECKQPLAGIPEEIAVAAFRITQEAVTNMLRHAHAKNLLVRVRRLPQGLELHINDDGLGFSPASDPALAGQRGMSGMVERASMLGATWTLHSEPGNGTRIDVLFPWAPRTHERAHTDKKP